MLDFHREILQGALMKVYLVQHGKPVAEDIDPERPLSAEGRLDVNKMAAFLKTAGVTVDSVFHSGKKRARETAEILCSALSSDNTPKRMDGLAPLDDVKACGQFIEDATGDMIIVGHLPHLGKLTALLTAGNENRSIAAFQQGGVLCVSKNADDAGWTISWMVVPDLLGGQ